MSNKPLENHKSIIGYCNRFQQSTIQSCLLDPWRWNIGLFKTNDAKKTNHNRGHPTSENQ